MIVEWNCDNYEDKEEWMNGRVPCQPPLKIIVDDDYETFCVAKCLPDKQGGYFPGGWWVAKVEGVLSKKEQQVLLALVKARYRELS